jgi:hypothetical protein
MNSLPDLPSLDDIGWWFATAVIGIPAALLLPAYLISWIVGLVHGGQVVIYTGARGIGAISAFTGRHVNAAWRALLAGCLTTLAAYLLFRTIDQTIYERFGGHDLSWPERLQLLIGSTPDGAITPTATLVTVGLLAVWAFWRLLDTELPIAVTQLAVLAAYCVLVFFAIVVGAIAALCTIGVLAASAAGNPWNWDLTAGTLQVLAVAVFAISTAGCIRLLWDRFDYVFGFEDWPFNQ